MKSKSANKQQFTTFFFGAGASFAASGKKIPMDRGFLKCIKGRRGGKEYPFLFLAAKALGKEKSWFSDDARLEVVWTEISSNFEVPKIVLSGLLLKDFMAAWDEKRESEKQENQYYTCYFLKSSLSVEKLLFAFAGWDLRRFACETVDVKVQQENAYSLLFGKVLRGKRENIMILTTNYDTLIEQALQDQWTYLIPTSANDSPNEIKIIKLHGSINWCHRILWDSRFASVQPANQLNRCQSDLRKVAWSDNEYVLQQPCIIGLDRLKREFNREGSAADPVIDTWFDALSAMAKYVLSKTKRLVIIGYSFPTGDAYARSLWSSLGENTQKILYVDKQSEERGKEKIRRKVQSFFPGFVKAIAEGNFYFKGFEKWLTDRQLRRHLDMA